MMEQSGEPLLLILSCCFTYPSERVLHVYPALCPVRVGSSRMSFGQAPSLHRLRHRFPRFVRRLRWYYGPVRLLMTVHPQVTPLGFLRRSPMPIVIAGSHEASRFSRRKFPSMPWFQRPRGDQNTLALTSVLMLPSEHTHVVGSPGYMYIAAQ